MLPEPGVEDKNSANGMAGTIPATAVSDIMTLGRTNESINKAEGDGTAHGQNMSAKVLQRALPTTVASHLMFYGSVC